MDAGKGADGSGSAVPPEKMVEKGHMLLRKGEQLIAVGESEKGQQLLHKGKKVIQHFAHQLKGDHTAGGASKSDTGGAGGGTGMGGMGMGGSSGSTMDHNAGGQHLHAGTLQQMGGTTEQPQAAATHQHPGSGAAFPGASGHMGGAYPGSAGAMIGHGMSMSAAASSATGANLIPSSSDAASSSGTTTVITRTTAGGQGGQTTAPTGQITPVLTAQATAPLVPSAGGPKDPYAAAGGKYGGGGKFFVKGGDPYGGKHHYYQHQHYLHYDHASKGKHTFHGSGYGALKAGIGKDPNIKGEHYNGGHKGDHAFYNNGSHYNHGYGKGGPEHGYQLALKGGAGDKDGHMHNEGGKRGQQRGHIEKLDLPGSLVEPFLWTLVIVPLAPSMSSVWLLHNILNECGQVVQFHREPEFCFVQYGDAAHAYCAVTCLNEKELDGRTLRVLPEEETEKRLEAWKMKQRSEILAKLQSENRQRDYTDAQLDFELEKTTSVKQAALDMRIQNYVRPEVPLQVSDMLSPEIGPAKPPAAGQDDGKQQQNNIKASINRGGALSARFDTSAGMRRKRAKLIDEIRLHEKRRRVLEIIADCRDIEAEIQEMKRPVNLFSERKFITEPSRWKKLARHCAHTLTREQVMQTTFHPVKLRRSGVLSAKVRPWLLENLHHLCASTQLELVELLLQKIASSPLPVKPRSGSNEGDKENPGAADSNKNKTCSFYKAVPSSATSTSSAAAGAGNASEGTSAAKRSKSLTSKTDVKKEKQPDDTSIPLEGFNAQDLVRELSQYGDAVLVEDVAERLWRMMIFELRRMGLRAAVRVPGEVGPLAGVEDTLLQKVAEQEEEDEQDYT
ncbi:unnamed protein product [Amoebophrya sp. A25]|nr:unnamed protein product [Amoebophrya sp. A25]|eukprot:GSA25T00027012001.1